MFSSNDTIIVVPSETLIIGIGPKFIVGCVRVDKLIVPEYVPHKYCDSPLVPEDPDVPDIPLVPDVPDSPIIFSRTTL